MGIGALIFQWREWVFDLPQWCVITIKHGPIRQLKKYMQYILDDVHL